MTARRKKTAGPRKTGRPRAFSDTQIEAALRATGGNMTAAATALTQASAKAGRNRSCTRSLVSRRCQENPKLRAVVDEALEEILDVGEGMLVKRVHEGDTAAIRFLLETRGKGRGYTRRVESTGPDGAPLQTAGVPTVIILPSNGRDLDTPHDKATLPATGG